MPDQISLEAQELIHQFQEEEAKRAAEKASRKSSTDQREIKVIPRRQFNSTRDYGASKKRWLHY